jgi:hypothetical protein
MAPGEQDYPTTCESTLNGIDRKWLIGIFGGQQALNVSAAPHRTLLIFFITTGSS